MYGYIEDAYFWLKILSVLCLAVYPQPSFNEGQQASLPRRRYCTNVQPRSWFDNEPLAFQLSKVAGLQLSVAELGSIWNAPSAKECSKT